MNSLKFYERIIRFFVKVLSIFPPSKVEKKEVYLRKGGYEPQKPVDWTIWIHAASLGEVITAIPLVKMLVDKYGKEHILLTSTTYDGYQKILSEALCDHATILPIELPEIIFSFVKKLKPKLVLINETEIWPLFLANLKKLNIPYGLINARINPKTVKLIKLFYALFRDALDGISFIFAQNNTYAARFRSLGININKIKVLGSFKYDYIVEKELFDKNKLRKKYGIPKNQILWCFGSTHNNEEQIILEAFEQILKELRKVENFCKYGLNEISANKLSIILAPRKINRLSEIEGHIKRKNFSYTYLSDLFRNLEEKSNEFGYYQIILLNKLGFLREMYAMSDLAFVGGSMVRHGGHNVLEPAIFGLPILTGPHTWNFSSEVESLKSNNGIIVVEDVYSLKNKLFESLYQKERYLQLGQNARNVINKLSGASKRTFSEVCDMLARLNV